MAHTKLFLGCFFAILVGLCFSVENENLPQEINYDTILNDEIARCRTKVIKVNRLRDNILEKPEYRFTLFNDDKIEFEWKSPEGTEFLNDDAYPADFHQGDSNNCWFISAASALLSTGWTFEKVKENLRKRFFADLKFTKTVGLVLFNPRSKLPVCIAVRPEVPYYKKPNNKNKIMFGRSDRNQMYMEMLEKAAAHLYSGYKQLEYGYPEEGHYVITGISDCKIYLGCLSEYECTTTTNLKDVLFLELGLKSAVTAATKISKSPTKEDEIIKIGLRYPHNYVIERIELVNGKFTNSGEAKNYILVLLYDEGIVKGDDVTENILKWKGKFNVASDFWRINPEIKEKLLKNLKTGQFWAEINELKSFFFKVTACSKSEEGKISFFKSSLPRTPTDIQNMVGYEFEIPDGEETAKLTFHLMENIPRLRDKKIPLVENYPAVIVVFQEIGRNKYVAIKSSCFEDAFSNSIVEENFPKGKYLVVPFSVCPLTENFYKKFDPLYTLKINSKEFKSDIKIVAQPISANVYWELLTEYVEKSVTFSISVCPQGETDCNTNHIQFYKKIGSNCVIYLIHNPLEYPVELQLDLFTFPEAYNSVSFWRGDYKDVFLKSDNKRYIFRQTLDTVPPKASFIVNIIWYKKRTALTVKDSPKAYKDFTTQRGKIQPLSISQGNQNLPERTPLDYTYKSFESKFYKPKCRHNVVD